MVVSASIGTKVSFFYQLPTSAHVSTAAPAPLTIQQNYILKRQQERLLIHSEIAMTLTQAPGFALPDTDKLAVLRVFGQQLTWQIIADLLQRLNADAAIACRVHQPHPSLTGALELHLAQILTTEQQQQVSHFAAAQGIELVYMTTIPTLDQPGVLVMDMDSTAIQIECIDEIAKLAGTGEQVAEVTARAMNGELDFAQSLVARVATLAGAPESILQQVLHKVPLMPGLTELVNHLQQRQWRVAIASGGFTYFTDALKQQLGLTATFANVLEIVDGKLTGKVLGDIVDANTKARVVGELANAYGIGSGQTVAIGDGANDIPMLNAAALGVAFHAKPKVQAQAKAAIRHGSLLQLLYLLD